MIWDTKLDGRYRVRVFWGEREAEMMIFDEKSKLVHLMFHDQVPISTPDDALEPNPEDVAAWTERAREVIGARMFGSG